MATQLAQANGVAIPPFDDWLNCHGESWQNIIVPAAFSHPAKFSRALIRRIYQHMVDGGWLEPRMTVLDPFGGVGLGALHAMKHGLHWVGVELEQKFVDLGQQNIDLWNRRFSGLPGWGSAMILQGDSRRLVEVMGGARACISSPPYSESLKNKPANREERIRRLAQAGYDVIDPKTIGGPNSGHARDLDYGPDPANLGNMAEGSLVDAVVSSPPYAGGCSHTGGDDTKPEHIEGGELHYIDYGQADGQLAALPEGEFEACVSSPPWEQSLDRGVVDKEARVKQARRMGLPSAAHVSPIDMENVGLRTQPDYGNSAGQLGQESSDTFWSAARQIVSQVYSLLAPGSPAVWVTKRFVRNKKIVEFSQQWCQLCESVGFELVHWHKAWLVEDNGTQIGLFGDDQRKVKKRYSFFRRLHAQKYPHLEIQWEDALCMVKR